MKLRDLFSFFTRSGKTQDPAPGSLRIVLCNDATNLHTHARSIEAALRKQGHKVSISCVSDEKELMRHLRKTARRGAPAPDAIFMDVGGVGEPTALRVISWFEKTYPARPLPEINFLSLSIDMGITEAGRLRRSDARVEAGFVDPTELSWLDLHLKGERTRGYTPASMSFRDVLNRHLGTKLPLKHDAGGYEDRIKAMNKVTNDRVITAWMKGDLSAAQAIEQMRGYALGVSSALRGGYYGQDSGTPELAADSRFYASAGFPFRGPAVFSLQGVEEAPYTYGYQEKPVLVMQSYDPAVVPLLASGRLGGLVVTSPYMASHLKLLCETHMVSGLFGLVPKGSGLSTEFNEEAKPDLPPYFDDGAANIGGVKVAPGQRILVGAGGNGVVLNPPEALSVKTADPRQLSEDDKLRTDIRNLQQMTACFAAYFAEQGLPAHGVKANLDTASRDLLEFVKGIGLVRTEQMAAGSENQMRLLKWYLLDGNEAACQDFMEEAEYGYKKFISRLDRNCPVKIRLFDFVHREILNKDEQKLFLDRYGKLDIHGGEALSTWPRLYREQVKCIFRALKTADVYSDLPLEIMMPAVRNEEDVIAIRKIVTEEAKAAGIAPNKYSFGVMAETLEACKNISAIAPHCDFISFGTNDLTSEQFDMSRSDLKAHAGFAAKNGYDPFKSLAPEILSIIRDVTAAGRAARPGLRVDVCGAQAADVETALHLFDAGVDNISVAPNLGNLFGLPVALGYRAFDALKAAGPKNAPQPAGA